MASSRAPKPFEAASHHLISHRQSWRAVPPSFRAPARSFSRVEHLYAVLPVTMISLPFRVSFGAKSYYLLIQDHCVVAQWSLHNGPYNFNLTPIINPPRIGPCMCLQGKRRGLVRSKAQKLDPRCLGLTRNDCEKRCTSYKAVLPMKTSH